MFTIKDALFIYLSVIYKLRDLFMQINLNHPCYNPAYAYLLIHPCEKHESTFHVLTGIVDIASYEDKEVSTRRCDVKAADEDFSRVRSRGRRQLPVAQMEPLRLLSAVL